MLSFIVVFGVVIPLMIWALTLHPGRKRRPSYRYAPPADATFLPPSVGPDSLPFGSSCEAGGGGGCDGGG